MDISIHFLWERGCRFWTATKTIQCIYGFLWNPSGENNVKVLQSQQVRGGKKRTLWKTFNLGTILSPYIVCCCWGDGFFLYIYLPIFFLCIHFSCSLFLPSEARFSPRPQQLTMEVIVLSQVGDEGFRCGEAAAAAAGKKLAGMWSSFMQKPLRNKSLRSEEIPCGQPHSKAAELSLNRMLFMLFSQEVSEAFKDSNNVSATSYYLFQRVV